MSDGYEVLTQDRIPGVLCPYGWVDSNDGPDHAAEEALKVYPQITGTFGIRFVRNDGNNDGGVTLFRRLPTPNAERVVI